MLHETGNIFELVDYWKEDTSASTREYGDMGIPLHYSSRGVVRNFSRGGLNFFPLGGSASVGAVVIGGLESISPPPDYASECIGLL